MIHTTIKADKKYNNKELHTSPRYADAIAPHTDSKNIVSKNINILINNSKILYNFSLKDMIPALYNQINIVRLFQHLVSL